MTSSKEIKKEIPEKQFSDKSDYAGKPIDEVINDAIVWEISAFLWRKNYERLKSENDQLAAELAESKNISIDINKELKNAREEWTRERFDLNAQIDFAKAEVKVLNEGYEHSVEKFTEAAKEITILKNRCGELEFRNTSKDWLEEIEKLRAELERETTFSKHEFKKNLEKIKEISAQYFQIQALKCELNNSLKVIENMEHALTTTHGLNAHDLMPEQLWLHPDANEEFVLSAIQKSQFKIDNLKELSDAQAAIDRIKKVLDPTHPQEGRETHE